MDRVRGVGSLVAVLGLGAALFGSVHVEAGIIRSDLSSLAVYSGGSFGADRDARINGAIGAQGDIWLGRNVTATSDVLTAAGFSSDKELQVGGRIVAGRGVSVDRDSAVGSIDAGGKVWLGRSTAVGGVIEAGGGASISRDATIAGDVRYDGSYWADESAAITGSVSGGASPDRWDAPTLTNPGLSSGGQSLWFNRNAEEALSAGDFGALSSDRNVTLHLTAGEYNFSSLWLGRDSRLIVDTSAGDVTLNVAGSFSTDRGLVVETVGAGDLLIQAGESLALSRESTIEAQLRSYGAANVARDSVIDGTLRASGDVWLDRGVNVTGRGMQLRSSADGAPVVPEPASFALFLLGSGLLATRPSRRRGDAVGV